MCIMNNCIFLKIALYCLFFPVAAVAKPFVTVDIRYELGNQMFQIAATVACALDNDYDTYFPDLQRCSYWGIPENYKHVFFRLNARMPPSEAAYVYKDGGGVFPIPARPNMRMEGFFQSEKYFAHHKEKILQLFAPSHDILDYLHLKYENILSHPCTVALHVRTYIKDYGHLPTKDELHSFAGVEYYKKAVALFPQDALFVVCSDDIKWCKENLTGIAPHMVFIENNKYYHDFYLMTLCHHVITANSTFSWWAAYLNRHENKKIVTLDNWFGIWWAGNTNNIVPKDWIRLSRGDT